jgi:hypothetical protein
VDTDSAWETIRENIKMFAKESLGYFELKKHKPWFDEGCSKLLDQTIKITRPNETSQIAVVTRSKRNKWG